jgi:hypothetical protein
MPRASSCLPFAQEPIDLTNLLLEQPAEPEREGTGMLFFISITWSINSFDQPAAPLRTSLTYLPDLERRAGRRQEHIKTCAADEHVFSSIP